MKPERDWIETENLMRGLWPKAAWTLDLMRLWRDEWSDRNQVWLRDVLRRVRMAYASPQPEFKWVAAEWRKYRFEQSGRAVEPDDNPFNISREDIERVEADQEATLRRLLHLPRAVVLEARDRVREHRIIGALGVTNESDDPAEWSAVMRGFVDANLRLHGGAA